MNADQQAVGDERIGRLVKACVDADVADVRLPPDLVARILSRR